MNLVKTSFYTSLSTGISFISGFIVTKVVAIKIGPEGMAYLGQFQNTTAILAMVATGAITTGVIKYLAEHRDNPQKTRQIINTAFVIVFCCSLIVSLFVMGTSGLLSRASFKTSGFWLVYFLFGLFTMAVSFNVLFSSVLNGLKEIKRFTIINIISSITNIIITIVFSYYFGIIGVLVSSSALSIILMAVNIYFFNKAGIPWKPDFRSWDKRVVKMLLSFSLMAVISGFLVPTMQILVRNKIINDFSLDDAGYWQAVSKISDYYLAFITTILGVYYLPRLSEIKNKKELRSEVLNGYKIILPVVGALALAIWLLKDLVIQVLLTPAFLPMKPLFSFQLLGDFFKIGSWLLAYLMLAKALVKRYIITELVFAASYVILSYYFINHYGVVGATYSFCLNYGLYWIVMAFLIKREI